MYAENTNNLGAWYAIGAPKSHLLNNIIGWSTDYLITPKPHKCDFKLNSSNKNRNKLQEIIDKYIKLGILTRISERDAEYINGSFLLIQCFL